MAWYHALGIGRRPRLPTVTPSADEPQALTASAATVPQPRSELLRSTDGWQHEAWQFYDDLGEFRYGVEWVSAMLSRVRLYAAKLEPGEDEPVRQEAGAAVEMMTTLGGGVAGQATLMSGLASQLAVPGEGYLVGETASGVERWSVRSTDEIRAARGHFEVMDETAANNGGKWRPLGDALVTRVWRPHKRYSYLADSPARAARGTMRELELVNRHILSQYLSRLASAGVVAFPDEVTFPTRPEFEDAPDPFMAEFIEIAAEAIRTPGTAASVVPIPLRMPGEYIDKVKHIDFTLKLDEKILEKRESAIKRLATQLNIPAEILLGMGDVNHWGAWQLEESSLKTHIAPEAEIICQALTTGYLQPRLAASGVEDPERWVVWYDMSELTLRPDRSDNAIQLYDRLEVGGAALRRETGFDEADKPTDEDLKAQALKIIIKTLPSGAGSALSALIGEEVSITPVAASTPQEAEAAAESDDQHVENERSLPDTLDEPPPDAAATARAERLIEQAKALHAVRFTLDGGPELLHPKGCASHLYSCPFTHAAARSLADLPRPGRSGAYELRLDPFGRLTIGAAAPHMNLTSYLKTRSALNGHAHSSR
ncbi:hypothetical protein [Streptomyces iconiensis]|uniref:Phage portal protein n=1 Tax=Streptomyces iconiensis TaxID=1384038 RepID=A0ABT7A9A8_9ACTN|nr:hypothetical protein [Streptomyces iconiensis]MDJ1137918.1 hypothetical protein [Streptomyces iconiensis]